MNIPDYLPALREVEMEISDRIAAFCKEHGIRCSIAYGSLLGAVRHGGFIPWDDDVDFVMPREDYDRFIALWKTEGPEGYLLQNKHTDWDFTQNFTKIRKDHTAFIQGQAEKTASFHTGIFVDIFPADRVATGKISRKWQIFLSAVNLLYARGFTSKSTGAKQALERFLLALPKGFRRRAYFKTEKAIGRWNGRKDNPWYIADTIEDAFIVFESTLFDNFTEIPFEDRIYPCFKDADHYLRTQYGDYMKLPPEEEQVFKHVHRIISLDKNYSEMQDA